MTTQQTKRERRRASGFAPVALVALSLLTVCGSNAVHAQSEAGQQAVPNSEIGHATNQWRALQRSNAAAAPVRPMLGAEANLAYKRYLESFNSKIPDFYGSSIGASTGGGSQGGPTPQN
ncbi:hypothetical protein P3T43_002350 [Paraburkholderia sp. GAS41]|jgi:hypothetical protein|uniref:DUF3613 domain-containing protein n=1 Tax=Paraburkholderia sp. GAS41 TaxID=3035134 RepID=UPI003D1F76E7